MTLTFDIFHEIHPDIERYLHSMTQEISLKAL